MRGYILATEYQQARIDDVIEVKNVASKSGLILVFALTSNDKRVTI